MYCEGDVKGFLEFIVLEFLKIISLCLSFSLSLSLSLSLFHAHSLFSIYSYGKPWNRLAGYHSVIVAPASEAHCKKWLFYLTQFWEKILIPNKIFKSTTFRNLVYLTDYVSCKNVRAYKQNNDGSKLA